MIYTEEAHEDLSAQRGDRTDCDVSLFGMF